MSGPKQNSKGKKGNGTPKRNSNKTRRQRNSRRNRNSQQLLTNTTVRHKELWHEFTFSQGETGTAVKLDFDSNNFPKWFDKIRKLYEMYQLHYIRIYTASSAATTTDGTYVLSYNTNYNQKGAVRTSADLAGQQNAKQGHVYKQLEVVIPASSLKNFRTNTPCDGTDSWSFNVEMAMSGNSSALTIPLWIEYTVTLRNPQV